jgi:hypothetical protein
MMRKAQEGEYRLEIKPSNFHGSTLPSCRVVTCFLPEAIVLGTKVSVQDTLPPK